MDFWSRSLKKWPKIKSRSGSWILPKSDLRSDQKEVLRLWSFRSRSTILCLKSIKCAGSALFTYIHYTVFSSWYMWPDFEICEICINFAPPLFQLQRYISQSYKEFFANGMDFFCIFNKQGPRNRAGGCWPIKYVLSKVPKTLGTPPAQNMFHGPC